MAICGLSLVIYLLAMAGVGHRFPFQDCTCRTDREPPISPHHFESDGGKAAKFLNQFRRYEHLHRPTLIAEQARIRAVYKRDVCRQGFDRMDIFVIDEPSQCPTDLVRKNEVALCADATDDLICDERLLCLANVLHHNHHDLELVRVLPGRERGYMRAHRAHSR